MKTFKHGGIHPVSNKLSAGKEIIRATLPLQVVIPLSQSLGAASEAVVSAGDTIKAGQLIGKARGFVSANVHASVSGKVSKIDEVPDLMGNNHLAVFIDVEGDEWLDTIDRSAELVKDCTLPTEDIIRKITEAGIVGLGGATFPTHVKLSPPPGKKADVLILNGVECEPYLTCDHQLMLEKTEEILVGAQILMKAIQVNRAIIGVENNKKDVIKLFKSRVSAYKGIEIVPLKVKYPQGGEKQLIQAVTGRRVPGGALPVDVGVVVQNVATAFAVYEAVQKNKPLMERVITVTGKSVSNPANYRVRLGTLLSDVVAVAGGVPQDTGTMVVGGPMMGKAAKHLDIPVTKGSAGILFLPSLETARKNMQNCIRCAKCVTDCPMNLEPYLLMTQHEREMNDEMEAHNIMDCIECGCCSYTCPANRPLLDHIRSGKMTVGGIIRSRQTK